MRLSCLKPSTVVIFLLRGRNVRPLSVRGQAFETAFSLHVPEGRCVGISLIAPPDHPLMHSASLPGLSLELPEEELAFPLEHNMSAKTAINFWGGRLAVRRALDENVPPILRHANGAPMLPSTYLGSISHKAPLAVSLVAAKAPTCLGIGVDLEIAAALKSDAQRLIARILDTDEINYLRDLRSVRRPLQPRLCFSLKEAIFKAFAAAARPVSFREIHIRPSTDGTCLVDIPSSRQVRVQATWRLVSCHIHNSPNLSNFILSTAAVYAYGRAATHDRPAYTK